MMYEKKGKLARILPHSVDRIMLFGDIHGDYDAFEKGIDLCTERDLLLFLGDYADRGPEGVEVIEEILELLNKNPDRTIALKGNHEDYDEQKKPMFAPCTLMREADKKRRGWINFWATFQDFASRLFLSAILPGQALFLHGGISSRIRSLEDLQHPSEELLTDILWSDPGSDTGETLSSRGAGTVFGPDISENVLAALEVSLLFRSHEPRKAREGPSVEHEGRVITVSSTGVYGGRPFAVVLDAGRDIVSQLQSEECIHFLD